MSVDLIYKSHSLQVPLKIPLQLRWRRGPDMPFGMEEPLSVVIQGRVYVGGGWAYSGKDSSRVMEYNTLSGKWDKLPQYRAYFFAMTAIKNQLVLVGGMEHDTKTKALGVWRADSKQWTHPYPDMPTARSCCSAVGYDEWLIVTGGWTGDGSGHVISSVDVMNTDCKQWYAGPPSPMTWVEMNTATEGDTKSCYFMGGYTAQDGSPIATATTMVYSVSLPRLLAQHSSHRSCEGREIYGLQTTHSTPLSISGSLLAVGGRKDGGTVSTICLYQPATGEWVKVGELPRPLRGFACTMITDREILVAGGVPYSPQVDIAQLV